MPLDSGERAIRDVKLSVISGPLQVVISAAGTLVIYPIILARSGIEILGLWSFVSAIIAYLALADVGFSSLLLRNVAQCPRERLDDARRAYTAARNFYVLLGLGTAAVGGLVAAAWVSEGSLVSSAPGFVASVVAAVLATTVYLVANLVQAVLSGAHATYLTQTINAATPAVRIAISLAGALAARPVEGLAFGALAESALRLALSRRHLARVIPEWRSPRPMGAREASARLRTMAKDGWQLYSISLGFLLREPVLRIALTYAAGLAAVGAYEIAARAPEVLRSAVAGGARALFPSFTRLHASGDRQRLFEIIRMVLAFNLGAGFLFLGGYFVLADAFLHLWLGIVPTGAVVGTRLMSVWSMITLANVPYWYLLQATGNERVASRSLWLHTSAILLVAPIGRLFEVSLVHLLAYWTVTALLTQVAIYVSAERLFGVVRSTFGTRRVLRLTVVGALHVTGATGLATVLLGARSGFGPFFAAGLGYVALSGALLGPLVSPLVRTSPLESGLPR